MVDDNFSDIFNDCIERLFRGESIEQCVSHYPKYAILLLPLLTTVTAAQKIQYPASEITDSQGRVQSRIRKVMQQSSPGQRKDTWRQLGLLAASIVLVLTVGMITAVASAQTALPGDALYGIKRFAENIELTFSSNAVNLRQQFAQERIVEVSRVLQLGRTTNVTWQGRLQRLNTATWQVAGVNLQLSATLLQAQKLEAGASVEVQGYTTLQGQVVVTAIRPYQDIVLAPQPEATATNTPYSIEPMTSTDLPDLPVTPPSDMTSGASQEPSAEPSIEDTPTLTETPSAP